MSRSFTISERIKPLLYGQDSLRSERPWKAALLSSVALSTLFIVVYGGSNALAAQRELQTCFFQWEKQIPFVPLLIIPYLSIDLFFVASFMLCIDEAELRTHSRRIALAILIAGVAFIIFPLSIGYARPDAHGWTSSLFNVLWTFDKPHNLVPSLHIALALLLWPVYASHTHGRLRWLIHSWFAMIVVSPLLTWQHHVIDIVTGAMLSQFCIFFVPEKFNFVAAAFPTRSTLGGRNGSAEPASAFFSTKSRHQTLFISTPNIRVASRCAAGSGALILMGLVMGSWAWLLLWPASSLAIMSIAYVRGDGSVFRKSGGRVPMSTRMVLGPYLIGMFVRRLIYKSRVERWREIVPGVYCGRLATGSEAEALIDMRVTAVLDMTAEHSETRALRTAACSRSPIPRDESVEYLNIPVLDLTEPSGEQLDVAAAFIAGQLSKGIVYVHCALGVSRSVSAATAYTTLSGNKSS